MPRLFLLAAGAALAAQTAFADADLVGRGLALAEQHCASCHATAPTGASPLAAAPPFRDLTSRWPVEVLAESLAEGIVTGHDAMPEFVFQPNEIDAFLAYLSNLKR